MPVTTKLDAALYVIPPIPKGMTTWRKELEEAFAKNGDVWADVESSTLSIAQMDHAFNPGWGLSEGDAFTLWTKTRVYFPAVFDGKEWVAWVSRHPDGVPTRHVGGE